MGEYYTYNYPGYPVGLRYPWVFPLPSENERDRRWEVIRKSMQTHNLDCLIIGGPFGYMSSPNNHIYYVSNFVPFYNPGIYVIFPIKDEPGLVVSGSIGPQFIHCASETSWINNIVEGLNPVEKVIAMIKRLKLEKSRIGIVGYMTGIFPALAQDKLRQALPSAIFEDATQTYSDAMNEVSRTSQEELTFLRKACEIHDRSYEAVVNAFKPGVSEMELWAIAEEAIIRNGGWFPHFMLATSGPRPTFPRAPASHYKLSTGDIMIFETNVVYGGVSSQLCYALSLGTPEKQVGKMFDYCRELYVYSLAELEKNRKYGDIENDLVNRIHSAGYEPMTPQIHVYNMAIDMPSEILPQPGDYFTVHPNFCDKEYTTGAKFGDTVRISEHGKVERLQATPAKLNIVSP